jgi:hypothetical protein
VEEPVLPTNRTGYVYGVDPGVGLGGHTWLTVPGSYHHRPQLGATPDDAERYAPYANVLALVEEVAVTGVGSGYGYRVIELVDP